MKNSEKVRKAADRMRKAHAELKGALEDLKCVDRDLDAGKVDTYGVSETVDRIKEMMNEHYAFANRLRAAEEAGDE